MAYDFEPLLGAMDNMLAIHGELVKLSREKQGVIIAGDTERLNAMVQREMRLMQESTATEKRRVSMVQALAAQAGLPSELGLAELARLAGSKDGARLMRQGQLLRSLIAEHKSLNEEARELLKTHLEFTDMMLNLLVGPEDPLNNIYGAQGTGDNQRRSSPGLFDKQA